MLKYYVVVECSGEYEDYCENIIGICPTISLAKFLKKKTEDSLSYHGNIPMDKFEEIIRKYYYSNYMLDDDIDEAEGIHMLFPEYSIDDIEDMLDYHYGSNRDKEIVIREINFYENENDLNNVTKEY